MPLSNEVWSVVFGTWVGVARVSVHLSNRIPALIKSEYAPMELNLPLSNLVRGTWKGEALGERDEEGRSPSEVRASCHLLN